ncbi:ubiquitinyl hydrolase 1 [Malassezia sp. CBS 17886]|nr:ubiquitinyl hydrolase 1 [Malassezia sp. CBS 17886]
MDLTAQLHAMGLYAADTMGDGNCLFRALSDQLLGYPRYHAQLRHEVGPPRRATHPQTCDQLSAFPGRYAGFVETEKPFDEYVRGMRELGTYGGHLELSAFAHLKLKPIRIVQPGLVYVVSYDDGSAGARWESECRERERARLAARGGGGEGGGEEVGAGGVRGSGGAAGGEGGEEGGRGVEEEGCSAATAAPPSAPPPSAPPPSPRSAREARRRARAQRREQRAGSAPHPAAAAPDIPPPARPLETVGPLHIAYHNWEHYSSLRNLHGPHRGLPHVAEVRRADDATHAGASDTSEGDDAEPRTEAEKMALISTRGHSLATIRRYLRAHGTWEAAVEALLQAEECHRAADGAADDADSADCASSATSDASTRSSATASSDGTGQLTRTTDSLSIAPASLSRVGAKRKGDRGAARVRDERRTRAAPPHTPRHPSPPRSVAGIRELAI